MNNPQHDEQNEAGDVAAEHVRIFDTTLRDGEQTPGFSMDRRAKLRMAQMLEALGVDVLEAGFPQASPDDFAAVAQIASTLRDTTACALARCVPGDIDSALNAASRIGDDTLQRESRGTVVPDSFTHGTSAQRQRWFKTGFQSGDVNACDTFHAQAL